MASSDPRRERERAIARRNNQLAAVVVTSVLVWTWCYNLVVKGQDPVTGFFALLDTLSEDVVTGSLLTFGVGLAIVATFTLTRLAAQVISHPSSFRMLEEMALRSWQERSATGFLRRLVAFDEHPEPPTVYPRHPSSALMVFALIYAISWVFLLFFSEALFFVSRAAGFPIPLTLENLELLPMLAIAIPFSTRVMAYLGYRHTRAFADVMPVGAFAVVLVEALARVFGSGQRGVLQQIWAQPELRRSFLRGGLLLAFLPVFSEAMYWLISLFITRDPGEDAEAAEPPLFPDEADEASPPA